MTQIHRMSPGWQGLYKRMQQRDHQGAKPPFWRETWFYEQIVYVLVCLAPAAFASWQLLAAKGPITTRDTVLLVGTMLGAFMSVATAPTWWHLPSILWATFAYDLWRNHRETRKLRKPEVVIGGF